MEKRQSSSNRGLQVYSSAENFELAQRIGQSLLKSDLIPSNYRGNLPNILIALEMASRIGASPLMVMQHLNIINGRPSWSSTFIISAINSCGRFEPLRFKIKGSGMDLSCYAYTKDKDGNLLEGPEVTMKMAKAEGWIDKKGSKWNTMPELMIRYRASAFWGRLFAPEITMGMQSAEEVIDVVDNEMTPILDDNFTEEAQQEPNKPKEEPVQVINTEIMDATTKEEVKGPIRIEHDDEFPGYEKIQDEMKSAVNDRPDEVDLRKRVKKIHDELFPEDTNDKNIPQE